jgi:hypothetical protein
VWRVSDCPKNHYEVKRPACTKTFVLAKTWTASPEQTTAGKAVAAVAYLRAPLGPPPCPANTADGRREWQIHLLGPPTDRVTLFQHFLI